MGNYFDNFYSSLKKYSLFVWHDCMTFGLYPNYWQGGFWPTWGDRRRESRKEGEANITLGKHNNKNQSVVQRANAVVLGTETSKNTTLLLLLNTELLFLNLKCYFSLYLVISVVSEPLFLQTLEDLPTTWPKVHLEIRTNWVFDLWFFKLLVSLAKLIPYITLLAYLGKFSVVRVSF